MAFPILTVKYFSVFLVDFLLNFNFCVTFVLPLKVILLLCLAMSALFLALGTVS